MPDPPLSIMRKNHYIPEDHPSTLFTDPAQGGNLWKKPAPV